MTALPKMPVADEQPETQRPWDRLPQESDSAWQAFVEYRDMGLSRTAQRVADILNKSVAHIFTYSSRFAWRQRTVAYERWLDGKRLDEFEKATRDMARRHASHAALMSLKAMQVIRDTPVSEITIREAVSMFRAAMPIERQARAADHPPPQSPAFDSIGDDLDEHLSDDEPSPDELDDEEEELREEPPPELDDH